MICQEFGCPETAFSRGMCKRHYNNWRRAQARGDDQTMATTIERDLQEARRCYQIAVGVPLRLKWRKRVQMLESQMGTAL